MKLISSDTNIWLDFASILRVELPFRLPYTYIMYDEALREEIITPSGLIEELESKGLEAVDISTEEFFYAEAISGKFKKLSVYDAIALSIAKKRCIPLLTGDLALRKAALSEGVKVFGTIGLLDRLYCDRYIDVNEYRYCLQSFLEDETRRLPANEIKMRLDKLSGGEAI